MRNYILFGVLFFLFGACSTHTTEFYEGNRYLYFDNEKGADTAFVSFSNYPGALSHEVAFRVFLTGELTETDLEYRLETVDSLTTAAVSDYKLPERLIFRKGMTVEWWKGDLQTLILGTYSPKKMEHFIIATGVNSLEGVELSVARAYALQFKRYCVSNGLTEEDGVTPMVDGIPCY